MSTAVAQASSVRDHFAALIHLLGTLNDRRAYRLSAPAAQVNVIDWDIRRTSELLHGEYEKLIFDSPGSELAVFAASASGPHLRELGRLVARDTHEALAYENRVQQVCAEARGEVG